MTRAKDTTARATAPAPSQQQRGAAMVEYLIATSLVALALIGNPGVVQKLIEAIRKLYQAFTYAISLTVQ